MKNNYVLKKFIGIVVLVIGSLAASLLWIKYPAWAIFVGVITLSTFIEMMKKIAFKVWNGIAIVLIAIAYGITFLK